ncbi:MAG: sugar phosphate nucleotidyltransferase, partial [Acidobacteriota bacterium]|nr:sugar phosphate nucleotidyltransferase [Acidobacteriota bacterium]
MFKEKVLALILAGGKGSRLGILTENKAKPVMPFGGSYRLIDFALSNCVNSQISDVWVIEQYELHSLNEHLSNGRPWDLDRTYGGLQVLPPFENDDESDDEGGFAQGNADAIYRHIDFIEEFNPDILLVLSADHVYKIDFRDAIKTHLEKKAALTMVTTRLPEGESASRFGVVKVAKNGRVTKFDY